MAPNENWRGWALCALIQAVEGLGFTKGGIKILSEGVTRGGHAHRQFAGVAHAPFIALSLGAAPRQGCTSGQAKRGVRHAGESAAVTAARHPSWSAKRGKRLPRCRHCYKGSTRVKKCARAVDEKNPSTLAGVDGQSRAARPGEAPPFMPIRSAKLPFAQQSLPDSSGGNPVIPRDYRRCKMLMAPLQHGLKLRQ